MSRVAAAALRMGRRQAERMFTSTATVRRATGNKVEHPDTMEEVDEFAVIHADVRCKVKLGGSRPADAAVPGQVAAETAPEWHVPMSVTGVRTGDQVTIDSVDPVTGDPELVGMRFRVEGPFLRDYATARRFRVEVWT